jgi:hypothetical protein
MSPSPRPEPGSLVRTIAGVVSLVTSLVVIAAGFVMLVTALQAGGYNTPTMLRAMAVLGLGGGLLATGIAVLIWEVSVRYGIRR